MRRSRPEGSADRLLAELRNEVSCLGVLDFYKGLDRYWIIDEADATRADAVRSRASMSWSRTTIMAEPRTPDD